jgi:IclR family mhp operon transcriptional activator
MQLAQATGLPRPTIYRLLHTLTHAGYVTHAGARDTFRLTNLVRSLSDGFDDEAWVTQVAGPVLAELGDKIVWPTDIATFDGDSMVVRETTHRRSPLSINREVPGFRPPVLLSSLGLAFLAWSAPRDQEEILRAIAASNRPDAPLARDREWVRARLAEVRRRGYGFREGGISEKTGSVAVPVMWRGKPLAAINIHYILSALTMEQVVDRYLGEMRAAARKMEEQLILRARPTGGADAGPVLLSEVV